MKLKRVDRTKDDWQKCCRWCHYYENGKCIKDNVSIEETAPVWKVAEEGHLSETLEEFFGSVKLEEFRELEYKLREWKVSEKRIKEFCDEYMWFILPACSSLAIMLGVVIEKHFPLSEILSEIL